MILVLLALALPLAEAGFLDFLPDTGQLEIFASHFQFLGLIGEIDIGFPISYDDAFGWTKSFTLDMEAIRKLQMPVLGIRWQFLVYGCFFPLILVMFMLLFFNPVTTVIWYFMFLFSIAMLGCACCIIFLPRSSDQYFGNQPFPAELILYGGLGFFMICLILAFVKYTVTKNPYSVVKIGKKPPEKADLQSKEEERIATRKRSKIWFGIQIFIVAALMFVALNLSKAVSPFGLDLPDQTESSAGVLLRLGAIILLSIVCCLALRTLLSCCKWGRKKLWQLHSLWVQYFIMLLFTILSFLYIPIVKITFEMFSFKAKTCNWGYKWPEKLSLIEQMQQVDIGAFDTSSECTKDCCEPCVYLTECPIMNILCPKNTEKRLALDESLSFEQHILTWFVPAAGLISLSFILGVPYMYYSIINGHCQMLSKVKCDDDHRDLEENKNFNEIWRRNMGYTDNSAKTLYEMFEQKWRYYKLLQILQKAILVMVTVMMVEWATEAIIISSSLHAVAFFAAAFSNPYISSATDYMASLCMFCDMGMGVVGILVVNDTVLPDGAFLYLSLAVLGFPLLAALAGLYYNYQQMQFKNEAQKKFAEVQKLKEAKENKDFDSGLVEADEVKPTVPLTKKTRGRGRIQERRQARNGERVHPIFLKVSQNRRKDVENFLMDDGVDPNIGDSYENTVLHYATLEGHKAIVKTCLRFGADVNIQNRSGNTPLHVAYAYKRDQIIDYLREKDADDTVRNTAGQDCFEVEGEKLPEFSDDLREDKEPTARKKKWEAPEPPKKAKTKVQKKDDPKVLQAAAEAKAKADEKRGHEEEEAAEDAFQEAKDDLHNRIAKQKKLQHDDKLMAWAKDATMAHPEIRATVDRRANEYTIRIMSRFFLATGGLAFAAFGCAMVGLLYTNQSLVISEPVRALSQEEYQKFEFLDYNNFPEFSVNCCCMARPRNGNVTASHVNEGDEIELWYCANGFRKERLRETWKTVDGVRTYFNGSKLRPFCGRSFLPGYCVPEYEPDVGRYVSRICNSTRVVERIASDQEEIVLRDLW